MVLQGLKDGVQKILSVFMMYVVAVKSNQPTMQMLKTDVLENSQMLMYVKIICSHIFYG